MKAVSRLLTGPNRYIVLIAPIVMLRILYGWLLYASLTVAGVLRTPYMSIWNVTLPFSWLWIFSAWDTAYYHDIAVSWYPPFPSPVWAFFPMYPAPVRLLFHVGVDAWVGCFIIATVFGLLSIPLFMKIAEICLGPEYAMRVTILYFLLPPVFVFAGVSYSESTFLLLALLTWYSHLRGHDLVAVSSSALCSLSRPYGILIVVPLLYGYIKNRQHRKLFYVCLPICALVGWLYYGTAVTNSTLPMIAAHSYWVTGRAASILNDIGSVMRGDFSKVGLLLPYAWTGILASIALVATTYLGYLVARIDKGLGFYVLLSTLSLFTVGGVAIRSLPRYLAFLFPIGLGLKCRKSWLPLIVPVLLVLDYVAWLAFLTDGFY